MSDAPGSRDAAAAALGNQGTTEDLVRTLIDADRAEQWTSLPCIVVKKSADGHSVTLKSAVMVPQRQDDGSVTHVELPVFVDVPINFSGGGGYTHTFPLNAGDEGWVEVSTLGQGVWLQNGGVQQPQDIARHALSDVRFRPGARSDPRKLKGVSPTSAQTRTDDKQSLHDVSATAVTAIRGTTAHQVGERAVMSQTAGTMHVVGSSSIQQRAPKFLHNC